MEVEGASEVTMEDEWIVEEEAQEVGGDVEEGEVERSTKSCHRKRKRPGHAARYSLGRWERGLRL